MATTVVHTIKASGGDYTSLSAWEAAQQRDLVALDEIEVAECYPFIDTTAVTVSGWTTGVNNYIIIRAHSSAKATIPMTTDGSRYLLRVTTDSVTGLRTSAVQNIQVYDIQVEMTSAQPNTFNFFPTSNTTFRNCVAKSAHTSNNGACWFFQGGGNIRLQNCVGIMVDGGDIAVNLCSPYRHDVSNVQYDNCAAIVNYRKRAWSFSSNTTNGIILRNCVSVNIHRGTGKCYEVTGGSAPNGGLDLVKSTNNISTDGTAFGTNAITNQPVIFANSSIGDYHLDWMDPVAQRSGVDLSASDTGSFSDDFDGNTRTAPWYAGPLRVSNSPNGIQLGNIENYTISPPTASLLGTDTHTQSITSTTWSKSLTIPAGTEQVYVGFGCRLNNATGMSLSGGGSGTNVVSLNGGVAGQPIAELWRIKNSTTGVNTLTVTIATNASIGALSIFYVKGIDPTTPEISTNSVDADASQPSLAMTTMAGGLVLDFASNYAASTGTGTPSGLQSEVLDVYVNQVTHVSSYLASTSTNTNIGWTLTNTNNTAYVAVALQPNRYQTPAPIIQLGSIGNSNILLSST